MPKDALRRLKAYIAKIDPEVARLRAKYGRENWVRNYVFMTFDPSQLDQEAQMKFQMLGMVWAKRSVFRQLFQRLYALYPNITDTELTALHLEWLSSGLEEYLWNNALQFCDYIWSQPRPIFSETGQTCTLDVSLNVYDGYYSINRLFEVARFRAIPTVGGYFILDTSQLDIGMLG